MSTTQTGAPCLQKLDPQKRVNYTFGMVLGVDEFNQEATYLIGKDHSQYRLAHGYGTICGLQVSLSSDLEVQVSTGVAINPRGQEIRVRQKMCARLNDWLTASARRTQFPYRGSPAARSRTRWLPRGSPIHFNCSSASTPHLYRSLRRRWMRPH